jgi:hypothetical protein
MATPLEVLAIEVASVQQQLDSIAERLRQHAAATNSRTVEFHLLNAIGHAHAASLVVVMGLGVALQCARRPAPSGLTDEDLAQAQEATSRG